MREIPANWKDDPAVGWYGPNLGLADTRAGYMKLGETKSWLSDIEEIDLS